MASGAVFDAIRTFLDGTGGNGAWTASHIRWENEPYDPTAEFVDVEMTGTAYGRQSIGAASLTQDNNRWDEEGVLWLHVLVPINTGGSLARTHAKALADLFRGLNTLMNGSLEFRDAFIGRGQTGFENGAFYRVSVYINWRRMDA
jgi:hypothetical protein